MVAQLTLHEEVTKIAEDYFGPVAPRFINRLITNHLNKDPAKLRRQDLVQLSNWTKLTVSMMTDDEDIVEEFVGRLQALSQSR